MPMTLLPFSLPQVSAAEKRRAAALLKALEAEIQKLSPEEFAELRSWLLARDWENWDRQIERDAASGTLDHIFEEAREAHRQGKSTKF